MFDGEQLKITFDNFCGIEPVTISCVYVAESADSGREVVEESNTPVTFDNGSRSVTIPAGEAVVSDAVRFSVRRGNDISVSLYLGEFTQMRSAVLITEPLSKGYYAVGDYAQSGRLPLDLTRNTNWFYFLSNVEIGTEGTNRAVICYGDSITSQAWPDYLTLRLFQEQIEHTAIVRRAASGTRILRQYIHQAKEYGLGVYMGTLLPIYGWRTYEPFWDELRCAVNEWIRQTPEIEGCIDFDKALCDSANPAAFAQGYDSGDHLHPSEKAYERMAAEVPDILLEYKEK